MEILSKKIIQYMEASYSLADGEKAVLQFGIQSFLEIGTNVLASILLLYKLDMIPKGIFFFAIFIPIRMYSGGYHADTYFRCFIFSILSLLGVMLISSKVHIETGPALFLNSVQVVLIWRLAPVLNAERPVSSRELERFTSKLRKILICVELVAVTVGVLQYQRLAKVLVFSLMLIVVTLIIGKIKYKDCQMEE